MSGSTQPGHPFINRCDEYQQKEGGKRGTLYDRLRALQCVIQIVFYGSFGVKDLLMTILRGTSM